MNMKLANEEQIQELNEDSKNQERTHLVRQYKILTSVIKNAEIELKLYKSALEKAAIECPGMAFEVDGYSVKLIECEREIISVKDAKAALGDAIAPFLKTSSYSMLKVN